MKSPHNTKELKQTQLGGGGGGVDIAERLTR